jgi:hypothetical protein
MYISLIPFVILILLYYIGTSVAMNVIGDKSPPDADGLYVVGAAPAIVARCDKVNDDALQLPLSPNADPVIRVLIDRREIRVVEALVKSVGALQTLDSLPSLQNNETHVNSTSVSPEIDVPLVYGDHDKYMSDNNVVNNFTRSPQRKHDMGADAKVVVDKIHEPMLPPPVDIHFTIKTGPPAGISSLSQNTKSLESITIEARLTPHHSSEIKHGDSNHDNRNESKRDNKEEYKTNSNYNNKSNNRTSGDEMAEAMGQVIGQVVLLTEVDNRHVT